MSKYYKVALVVDANDYGKIAAEVKTIADLVKIDCSKTVETPDNKYICLYWDSICWGMPETIPLVVKLEFMRHSLIAISEDGEIWTDIETCDENGTDEEFHEILSWDADILCWEFGEGMFPLSARNDVPMTRDRAIHLLKSYLAWDLEGIGSESVFYDNLIAIGFSESDIEVLGYGCCIPRIETGISEIINKKYPEILNKDGSFKKSEYFLIGFKNPGIEKYSEDDIANDETTFEAESVYDLINLYCDFCDENNLPYNTVKYVDIVGNPHPDAG